MQTYQRHLTGLLGSLPGRIIREDETVKLFGIGATIVGAAVLVVALLADYIGIGDDSVSTIGLRQGAAIAAGAIVLIVGLVVLVRQRSSQDASEDSD